MRKIMNCQGMALPVVLGIVIFLIASVMVMLSFVIYQSTLIEADFEYKEDYINAATEIEATLDILVENEDFSSGYLAGVSTYMGVDISTYSENTWMISKTLENGRLVRSYLSSLGESTSLTLMDNLFAYDGLESNFTLNPVITPAAMLDAHLKQFFTNTFPSINYTGGFASIASIFTYIDSLTASHTSYLKVSPTVLTSQSNPTVTGHWYVDGNVTIGDNKNLTIPAGYLLFINGSLTMKKSSTISGNLVVSGNVSIAAKKTYPTLSCTIYTSGFFATNDYANLGTALRPTFVISEREITFNKTAIGYGFFLGTRFSVDQRGTNINIIGGAYAPVYAFLDSNEIQPFTGLDVNKLYSYAIPSELSGTGGSSGTTYLYTKPTY